MSLFSKQRCFCPACGAKLEREIEKRPGYDNFCNMACWIEWEWRYTLSTMGKEYYPDPQRKF